jgi:hypothetical protein
MPINASVWHHLELYLYWFSKRGNRVMPSRSDINPVEIPVLLPFLSLVDKVEGQFRYRLVGTAVAQQFGHEMTGRPVGFYVTPAEHALAQRRVYERIFSTAQPVFVTGEYRTKLGAIHSVSRLMLPLSDDGEKVNMVIFSRVARFSSNTTASGDWLKGATGRIRDVIAVRDARDVKQRCLEWEELPRREPRKVAPPL